MIRQFLTYLLIFVIVVSILTLRNYNLAQKNLRQTQPTVLSIELTQNLPEAQVNTPVGFTWKIVGPESFSAVTTGIYWGYDSTPSAATKYDSPKALAYHNYTEDYRSGLFRLPEIFDASIVFSIKGTVFYRAYALVGEDHLWTEERQLEVK